MFCYNCGCQLSEHDFCTACGADVYLYKKIMFVSNMYYNDGLEKAEVRDLTGAITSLRQSLKFNKNNIDARNLLGLVYFETGEVVAALSEWVISKNLRPEKNIADDYIDKLQSNSGRLDSINQTIKKYNQALVYCQQDSKDLAVIQLKKVLSLNPRFIRAHQLLALLYMDSEQWERAERELRKCIDIDRNNTKTLRYLKEVELMLVPDETVKQSGGKRRKDETVRYISDNEMIIQPLNVKEPKNSGVSTLVNLGIGLVIGLAVTYFLLVPAAQSNTKAQMQDDIRKISNESDAKTVRIQELESEAEKLNSRIQELQAEIEGFVGAGGTVQTYDSLLTVAADYLTNQDNMATAADLENIVQIIDLESTSEGFQSLYQTLRGVIGPELAVTYYNEGFEYFRHDEYPAAIESLDKAVYYDETHMDALYYLARAYHANGNPEEAIETYQKVLELFPDSVRVNDIRSRLRELGAAVE
ncbi:MAG: tetratricopeptide repeat protein [Acetatifactor sp.]|nr:tetratricopeptide repeat protein [Acetatifactor sp.]